MNYSITLYINAYILPVMYNVKKFIHTYSLNVHASPHTCTCKHTIAWWLWNNVFARICTRENTTSYLTYAMYLYVHVCRFVHIYDHRHICLCIWLKRCVIHMNFFSLHISITCTLICRYGIVRTYIINVNVSIRKKHVHWKNPHIHVHMYIYTHIHTIILYNNYVMFHYIHLFVRNFESNNILIF